jgi:hypothetical protein
MSLANRIARLEERLAALPPQTRPPRVEWCARLLGETHSRTQQLAAAPDDPALVTEFRLDQFLERPETWDQCEANILRPVEIHTDMVDPPPPHSDPYTTMGESDERFPRLWISRLFARIGERILVHGRKSPSSWPEAFWAAGESPEPEHDQVDDDDVRTDRTSPHPDRGPRLFLACVGDEIKAIRAHADGTVESRGFAGPWTIAGKVPPSTTIEE